MHIFELRNEEINVINVINVITARIFFTFIKYSTVHREFTPQGKDLLRLQNTQGRGTLHSGDKEREGTTF